MFDGARYPNMVSGSGYVVDADTAQCLFREIFRLPYFHLEDVLVTGFARQACEGARVVDSKAFRFDGVWLEDLNHTQVRWRR